MRLRRACSFTVQQDRTDVRVLARTTHSPLAVSHFQSAIPHWVPLPQQNGFKDLARRFPKAPQRPVVVSSRNIFAVCDLELLTQPDVRIDYEMDYEAPSGTKQLGNWHVVEELERWLRTKNHRHRSSRVDPAMARTEGGGARVPAPPPRRQAIQDTVRGGEEGRDVRPPSPPRQEELPSQEAGTELPGVAPGSPGPDSDYEYEIVDDL